MIVDYQKFLALFKDYDLEFLLRILNNYNIKYQIKIARGEFIEEYIDELALRAKYDKYIAYHTYNGLGSVLCSAVIINLSSFEELQELHSNYIKLIEFL